ncbi:hypothetical protein HanRHA438_Chr04g0156741 [Helianthus annuus]|uniref:Uncharacterized protein n=1 Tax=Helianthus annuus TaxID=4232 RepID=A0A9K3J4Y8_HELAN|nr:hypothetical protein HanXRQr2_Chr04g0146651 [Helianthus annuus]KAJ0586975.1 hypothetical protein HanIR_Chr04g0157871 [Helianthus annuus]KAJ0595589.1 hypothetical protein HanHA89_Chr04g0132991 [Helianthus annuus]KAJ0925186.1 hypothetical protein HanRHA438_Chr04g0156741 [Helianthus annuus]KAJ0929769.1 hypothetical protein HanPSC8_Chr04g0141431 [Helianthus annuus]
MLSFVNLLFVRSVSSRALVFIYILRVIFALLRVDSGLRGFHVCCILVELIRKLYLWMCIVLLSCLHLWVEDCFRFSSSL